MNIKSINRSIICGATSFCKTRARFLRCRRRREQQSRLERQNERLKSMVGELHLELKKAIGKALSVSRCCPSGVRCTAVEEDSSSQVGASVLELSTRLGLFKSYRLIINQLKARLPAFERKRFTGQSLDAPFGEADLPISCHWKAKEFAPR